jgi:hypothetical protein
LQAQEIETMEDDEMHSSNRAMWIVFSGAILGILADYISLMDSHPPDVYLGFWMGFSLLIPLALLFLCLFIKVTHLRNRPLIISCSAIMFLGVMFFTFWLYDVRHYGPGQISDMYALFYLIGFAPAIIVGIIYGILLPATPRNKEGCNRH